MTVTEHNEQCPCTSTDPCAVLAAILHQQHYGILVEVAGAAPANATTHREART